jgi:hypothetical protein
MKSLLTLLVTALVVLTFSAAGFAQAQNTAGGSQQPPIVQKKVEPTVKAMTFTGEVTAVNTSNKTIVVKGKEGEKTFDVSKATMGSAVKPGQTVSVTYTEKEGKMVASSVNSGTKTSMNGPAYGYDPYYGYSPYFYGYDPYGSGHKG